MSHRADDPLSHLQKSHDQQRRGGKGNEAGSVGNRQMPPKWLNPASAATHQAGIERSHMGKIERGEHMPTLALALKVARALGISAAILVARTEQTLPASYRAGGRPG